MKTFRGKINDVEYTNEEEFRKALAEIDLTKGYSVSFSTEEHDMSEDADKPEKHEEFDIDKLYPQFDLDKLAEVDYEGDFEDTVNDKFKEAACYSANLKGELLEEHVSNIRNITKNFEDKLQQSSEAYDTVVDRVSVRQNRLNDLEDEIEKLKDQIKEDEHELDILDNAIAYLEDIVDGYKKYLNSFNNIPEVKGCMRKEQKVSEQAPVDRPKCTCKEAQKQQVMDLDAQISKCIDEYTKQLNFLKELFGV